MMMRGEAYILKYPKTPCRCDGEARRAHARAAMPAVSRSYNSRYYIDCVIYNAATYGLLLRFRGPQQLSTYRLYTRITRALGLYAMNSADAGSKRRQRLPSARQKFDYLPSKRRSLVLVNIYLPGSYRLVMPRDLVIVRREFTIRH